MSHITPDDVAQEAQLAPMSEQEFLDALKRTPRDWKMCGLLIRVPCTRQTPEEHCPITAVIRQHLGKRVLTGNAQAGGQHLLNLDDALVRRILKAADGPLCHEAEELRLRSRMLDACGIQERAA